MPEEYPEGGRPVRTVLVVEDDPSLRSLLQQYLSQQGLGVVLESDGYRALQHFDPTHAPPDLILTDVSLPGLNGYELLGEVRRRRPRLPVVFLTGLSDNGVENAAAPRPDAILKKPIRLAELGEVVLGLLER